MDETNTPAPEPVTEQADQQSDTPPAGNTEKMLPQSEVNRLVANARREGRESAAKQAKPAQAPAQQPSSQPAAAAPAIDALAAMQTRLEEMELRLQYAPNAARVGWDDTQSATMFDLFKTQRPQDATDWFSRMEQMFPGSRKQAPASPQPAPAPAAAPQTPAQPAKPNVSDRGTAAPVDNRDSMGILNSRPLEMTGHDYDSLLLKEGEFKGNQMFQERVLAALARVKIKSPNGGR